MKSIDKNPPRDVSISSKFVQSQFARTKKDTIFQRRRMISTKGGKFQSIEILIHAGTRVGHLETHYTNR